MATSGGFWKPASHIREENRNKGEEESSSSFAFNFSRAPLAQQRLLLPIYKHKRQILYSIEKFSILIIVGETGSGKSTQIPQYLYENGWADHDFQVVCTQPRRIAAQSLAQRVSQEAAASGSSSSGNVVGYTVRFDNTSSLATTRIKFVTDGILLREATLNDPLLSRYSVVMVDEAHERNLNTDTLLGLLKKIRRKRKDLRIVVCSATIDAQAFLDFFCKREEEQNHGTIISVDGRQHAVDFLYLAQPTSDYIRATVETALRIQTDEPNAGDILCFLPSGEDIDRAIRMAEDSDNISPDVDLLPLYGTLPYQMQARVFQQSNSSSSASGKNSKRRTRIIFATNIAETSVTVPNITHVIDCGLAKLPYFDPKTGFDRLIVAPISQASARQRAGRAGRVRSGKCFRLYTEAFFSSTMADTTPPEVLRTNLTGFILTLKALGVDNILAFDLMDLPSVDALSHGLECLYALGAMDDQTNLTKRGMDMSAFPTEPRVSRMLLESLDMECSWEVLGVASALQVRDLFMRPPAQRGQVSQQQKLDYDAAMSEVADRSGDHVTFANLIAEQDDREMDKEECREKFINYLALRRAIEVRNQLSRFLRNYGRVQAFGLRGDGQQERSRAIRKCVTAGFFVNVAKLANDGRYYTIRGKRNIMVMPSTSSIFHSYGTSSEYIVFGETHDGPRGGIELKAVSSIEARWLRELAPHYWE